MKKLSKTELEALSRKVRSSVVELIEVEQDRLDKENEAFYRNLEIKVLAEINGLGEDTKKFVMHQSNSYGSGLKAKHIRAFFRKEQAKYRVPAYRDSGITDALILAQLEVEDLATLIQSVVDSFTCK